MELKRLQKLAGIITEEASMTTQQAADKINDAFKKSSPDFFGFRVSELGNLPGKVYTIVKDKNYNNGKPVAKFRVPVVSAKDAGNNEDSFKKVIDSVWHLRSEGFLFTPPQGGVEKNDSWSDKGGTVNGNIMTFYVAGKE